MNIRAILCVFLVVSASTVVFGVVKVGFLTDLEGLESTTEYTSWPALKAQLEVKKEPPIYAK